MLYGLIDRVSDTISELDPNLDAPAFVDTWLQHRPEQRESVFPEERDPGARQTMFEMFAAGALTIVKRIPEMMTVMTERLRADDVDPAVRCAVATVLAYVVKPRDLIPDDAPGGYGFVDDAILVHAGYLDILSLEPPHAERFKTQEEYLSYITSFAPTGAMTELHRTIENMEQVMSVFRMLPAEALELTTDIIVADPFSVSSTPLSQEAGNGFRSARFLEDHDIDVTSNVTRTGDGFVVQFPNGDIFRDSREMRQA